MDYETEAKASRALTSLSQQEVASTPKRVPVVLLPPRCLACWAKQPAYLRNAPAGKGAVKEQEDKC